MKANVSNPVKHTATSATNNSLRDVMSWTPCSEPSLTKTRLYKIFITKEDVLSKLSLDLVKCCGVRRKVYIVKKPHRHTSKILDKEPSRR